MDHQVEVWKVDTACGDVCRHADLRPTIAHGLQRVGTFGLRQLTRKRHDLKPAIRQAGCQAVHHRAGVGKNNRVGGFVIPQRIDHRVVGVAVAHHHGAVGDIRMLACFGFRDHANGIALVAFRQLRDHRRHGGREEQRLTVFGGFAEDKLKVFAEAQIEHFVGLVQHNGATLRQVDGAAHDVVAQAARSRDDDMRATL